MREFGFGGSVGLGFLIGRVWVQKGELGVQRLGGRAGSVRVRDFGSYSGCGCVGLNFGTLNLTPSQNSVHGCGRLELL